MNTPLKRICIYCGSSSGHDPVHRAVAREVGAFLARQGIGVVYGGGNVGLMGAVADGALDERGEVIGVIPRALMEKELGHRGVTELHVVGSMHERKALMVDLSDAFIALPGGFGTLDELFETITLVQTGKSRQRPILLFGRAFWEKLINFDHLVDTGMINAADLQLFRFVETAEEAWEVLATHYGFDAPPTQTGEFAVDI